MLSDEETKLMRSEEDEEENDEKIIRSSTDSDIMENSKTFINQVFHY